MAETIFGQMVVGPPGSGKSTYCKFICENLKQLGRNAKIINLDPANDCLPYKPAIDLMDLVNTELVMEKLKLGPNGAIIHCMEVLSDNYGWLFDQITSLVQTEVEKFEENKKKQDKGTSDERMDRELNKNKPYLIFDCPGQSELYTHHTAMRETIKKITARNKYFDLRLVCLNLCDAHHVSDLGKYIGLLMNSLSTMMNLELPHLNILSKVDMIEKQGKTRFNLDFYTEVLSLDYLLETDMENPFFEKYRELSKAIMGVIEQYSLVHFIPLNIQSVDDIYHVVKMADKANGYYINDLDLSILQLNPRLMEMASGRRIEPLDDATV